jgi:streptogramin lyase
MQVTAGSAWIAADDGVQQLDGKTGAPKARIPAGVVCTAMDVGFERLWVADCAAGTVIAIDPKTAKTKTYSLNGSRAVEEGSVAAGEGAVWVTTPASTLVRLDPKTGATTVILLPAPGAGARAGLGSVWVTSPSREQVFRVRPSDGSVIARIPAGRQPRFLAIGGDPSGSRTTAMAPSPGSAPTAL